MTQEPEGKVFFYSESISLRKEGDNPWQWKALRNGEQVGKGNARTLKGALTKSKKAIRSKNRQDELKP